jgi:hypothetical protein
MAFVKFMEIGWPDQATELLRVSVSRPITQFVGYYLRRSGLAMRSGSSTTSAAARSQEGWA